MVTPPIFVDLPDEEAYEQARERLICDYCNYKHSSRKLLHDPIEVYSSQRRVKRWVCICRTCVRAIESYERKMLRKKNKIATEDYLHCEDDEVFLSMKKEKRRNHHQKLRYVFEVLPESHIKKYGKKLDSTIDGKDLKETQEKLGLIHDSDITMDYLQNSRQGLAKQLVNKETAERNNLYIEFVKYIKE